jgi:hypothetical protein
VTLYINATLQIRYGKNREGQKSEQMSAQTPGSLKIAVDVRILGTFHWILITSSAATAWLWPLPGSRSTI